MHSGRTAHQLGRIPLVIGMPIIISQNFDVAGGIVNGSIGTLSKICYVTDSKTDQRFLTSCVVCLSDSTASRMPGLDNTEYPILPDTVKMKFSHPYSGKKLTVARMQVPVQPTFSLTVYKAQGQTFRNIIVDLQGCTGTEAPYVMLSRATSIDGILVLRPFDKKKIRCRPSEDFRKECRRLCCLRMETWLVSGLPSDREYARKVLYNEFENIHLREQCDSILTTMGDDAVSTLNRVQQPSSPKRARSCSQSAVDSSKCPRA